MKQILSALAIGLSSAFAAVAVEAWPARPLHAVVPYGAGSTTDIVPRLVLEELSARLGQGIVVENRSGAGGTIGAAAVAKSAPDGQTLLINSNAHTIAPAIYSKLAYDPARDFAAVIPLGTSASVLVVAADKPFKTTAELVAVARARPGALTFASVGMGSATHLSAVRFVTSAGIEALHVPFRGGAEAMSETMTGRVDFFLGPVGLVLPLIEEGKLRPLAVNAASRAASLPDVPTMREAGLADAEYPIWFGIFVPARTPREIVERLHAETRAALQAPGVSAKLKALGVDPLQLAPAEFDDLVRKEIAMNRVLVDAAGIKPE
ncbi:Bug family tripartite tricarboxylate transporter substrate binding protein [Bradyrhizobium sp. BWC-3-1]|uniref:Bug family tripartite tricarboxylate transporter substrate binding protein n=1 Tax=Bradyrhizobium sp. BWC-3-1 TaxID=3080012 RepID=UPI00293F6A3E|nr:tripartite tricarboxylate transporter substrate-binding protein [Bradyrhizobium sp. BWC-3-1]WOH60212.1 tripartite tricarboxylate transporter substrate-binding protein [Bradyrhizobium sp. BWC-3-1]